MLQTLETSKNRFEVIKVLGEGGQATVYHVRDKKFALKEVALKVLNIGDNFELTLKQRFLSESLRLIEFNHPNIVKALDVCEFEGKPAYSMEYIEGKDLSELFRDNLIDDFSFDDIKSFMSQLLSALSYLHSKECYHRDLKPENIMIKGDGTIKLNDFGCSTIAGDAKLTDPNQMLGTAHYIAPEYIGNTLNPDVRHLTDIYSCGIIMWELLNKKRRFDDELDGYSVISKLIATNFSHPELNLSGALRLFKPLVEKAVRVNPKERYQSADEMLSDITNISAHDDKRYKIGVREISVFLASVAILLFLRFV